MHNDSLQPSGFLLLPHSRSAHLQLISSLPAKTTFNIFVLLSYQIEESRKLPSLRITFYIGKIFSSCIGCFRRFFFLTIHLLPHRFSVPPKLPDVNYAGLGAWITSRYLSPSPALNASFAWPTSMTTVKPLRTTLWLVTRLSLALVLCFPSSRVSHIRSNIICH